MQRQYQEERERVINDGLSSLQVEASRLASQEVQIGQCMRHIQQRNHELAVVESNVYSRKAQQAAMFREQIEQGVLPSAAHANALMSIPSHQQPLPIPPASSSSGAATGIVPGMKWSLDGNNPYRPGANTETAKNQPQMQGTPMSPTIHDQFYFVNSVPPPPQLSSTVSTGRSSTHSPSASTPMLSSALGRDENVLNGATANVASSTAGTNKKWSQKFQEDLKRVYSNAATSHGAGSNLLLAFNAATASSPSAAGALLHQHLAQKELPKEVRMAQRVMRENKIILESVQTTSLNARRTLESDEIYVNSLKLKQRSNK
jgi:hypothetical protein